MGDIEAVIFDRDGVLADFDYERARKYFNHLPISLGELGQRWQQWGDLFGFPANLEQEIVFFDGFWRNLGDELLIPENDLDKFRKFNYAEYLLLFPDVWDTLIWLKDKGIRIGVLTNFTLASVEMSLRSLGIWDYIDVACGATVIGVPKPHAKAYKIVLDKLEADPRTTLFLDDEARHVDGARSAGILNAFLVNRSVSGPNLTNGVIKDLTEIMKIVEHLKHPSSD